VDGLRGRDYALWVASVLVMFFIFAAIGDFGNIPYLIKSPISSDVAYLWRLTYFAADGVFAVFMGSIIFLSFRFRATSQTTVKTEYDYTKIAMPVLIVAGAFLVYVESLFINPSLYISGQFTVGMILAFDLFLLSAIIFVVYKAYYD
jgi:amino acid permease